ncbi:hypothetical protein [Candidatus Thiothrix anitrata]|uniref:hypothetical protein n=1 Tax=Candidatus Thiothrix anitrata TaxID=2823902 RepID=UPI001D18F08A|nr:hypothetical protein [Candidatus Thiothrix anitrata]
MPPDPTDAVNIAKGVARYEATLLFGTGTFLRLYAKNSRVHPLMFQSLRYVVAGRKNWHRKCAACSSTVSAKNCWKAMARLKPRRLPA